MATDDRYELPFGSFVITNADNLEQRYNDGYPRFDVKIWISQGVRILSIPNANNVEQRFSNDGDSMLRYEGVRIAHSVSYTRRRYCMGSTF